MRWLAFSVLLFGCSGPSASSPAPEPCRDGTWLLAGEVNDEACIAFRAIESKVVTDVAKAPRFLSPDSGNLPSETPVTFTWANGTLARSWLRRLLHALDPLPEAWAHGSVSGDVAVLTFRDANNNDLIYRVLTSGTEFTPDLATWAKLRRVGQLEVTLVGVRYASNVVTAGPMTGAPLKLTLP